MKSLIAFLAVLGLSLVIAGAAIQPPAPAAADAPDTAFSAQRAMADIRRIARAPHPTGSAENAHVRDYLVRRFEDMGLEVSIQRTEVLRAREPGWATGANVENIVATLPGEDRDAPVILLMSHYDSAAGSPGAADDAAGVASSLEAVRAILADDRPRPRDLVVLITDAEEQGLLGAQAFFEDHPLRERIGAIVNLETRGAAGRAFMFQTGPSNGAMMGLYARKVSTPSTTSLAAFLYSILPNDTDFTHAVEAGMAGFNIAFIGEPFHYHSVTSTPATLDQASLQHMGGQALDLTRALVEAESLPAPAPDAVFSDVFGLFTLAYPAWGGWLILVAAGGLILSLALRSSEGSPRLKPLLAGAGAGLAVAVVAALLGRLVLIGTGTIDDFVEGRPLLGRLGWLEAALFLAGLAAALLIGRLALKGWRGGPDRDPESVALGLVGLGWLLALALQILAPAASLLLAWPTLLAAFALLARRRLGAAGPWVAGALCVLALAWALTLIEGIFLGVGSSLPEAVCALTLVAVIACAPFWAGAASTRLARPLGLAALILAVAATGWLRFAPQSSPERPAFSQVLYVADPAAGDARLVSAMSELAPWSRTVLESGGGAIAAGSEPALWLERVDTAPVEPVPVDPVSAAVSPGPDGRYDVVLTVPARVRELRLTVEGEGVSDIQVQGRAMEPAAEGEPVRIRWSAPGSELRVSLSAPTGATLRWAALTDGWPDGAPPLPRRPADLAPWGASDSLVVVGEAALRRPG
jgi:hypothetical protein